MVLVAPIRGRVEIVVRLPRSVRQERAVDALLPRCGRRVKQASRHLVVVERLPRVGTVGQLHRRERIEDLADRRSVGIRQEPTLSHFLGRNGVQVRALATESERFPVGEPERAVLDDGTADCRTELVPTELRLPGGREERTGIEIVVPEELEDAPMDFVGSGLDRHVHVGTGGVAELGARDVRLNRELLDGVEGRADAVVLEEGLVVVDAIERVIVLVAAIPRHGDGLPADDEESAGAGTGRRSRQEHGQLRHVAAVERQFDDLLVSDYRAEGGSRGLEQRRDRGRNLDRFDHFADLQDYVDTNGFVHPETDTVHQRGLEPVHFDCQVVSAGQQVDDAVIAGGPTLDSAGDVRALVRRRHHRSGNDCVLSVGDAPHDRPVGVLAM